MEPLNLSKFQAYEVDRLDNSVLSLLRGGWQVGQLTAWSSSETDIVKFVYNDGSAYVERIDGYFCLVVPTGHSAEEENQDYFNIDPFIKDGWQQY